MVRFIEKEGHVVNRKRAQGGARGGVGCDGAKPHHQLIALEHKGYPCLLRGVFVVRFNPAWRIDIIGIRLARGFVYRVAIIDW